jgi:aminocarboxymuconate-semialdehyde decarboxylase
MQDKHDGTIDVHAHIVAEGLLETLQTVSPEHAPSASPMEGGTRITFPTGRTSGPIPPGMTNAQARLEDMETMGVWHQAISPPPFMFPYGLPVDVAAGFARAENDSMLALASEYPERISVLCDLPMQHTDASLAELERVGRDPRVRGVAVGSAVAGLNLDEAQFEPIWEAIAELNLGVLVHPVDAPGSERMKRYYLRNFVGNPSDSTLCMAAIIFGGVLERHPNLRFLFLHGGGFGPYQIGRWEHGWERRPEAKVVIDKSPKEYFEKLYFDSLTHDRLSLEFLIRRVGPGQVVVGSDYMFDMGDWHAVDHVRELGLPADVERAILKENALRFLR